MSALAGIYHWDGRPVLDRDATLLATHSRAAGPDGGDTARPRSGLILQAHLFHFDEWSAAERQPHPLRDGGVLTFDGRLDNRDDLRLTLHHDLDGDHTDVALVAAAFARWGLDALPRLVGDWSLALWDAAANRLVLARDYMGNRPLYYAPVPNGIAWATRLAALVTMLDRWSQPSDAYVVGRLTFGVAPGVTPFEDVSMLRAGHLLLASPASRLTVRRYWTFKPETIRYRDPRSYVERLRMLLTESVRVRLRARGTVWAHLSGGWDSSAIVCLAQRLIQQGSVPAAGLQPISMVFSASPESDDRPYIEAVERWCGLKGMHCEGRRHLPFAALIGEREPLPVSPLTYSTEPVVEAAGGRLVLSGTLGDLISRRDNRLALLEPLHAGRPMETLRLSRRRAQSRRRPLISTLLQLAQAAYLPPGLRTPQTMRRRLALRGMGAARRTVAAGLGLLPAVLARAPRLDPDASQADVFPFLKRPFVQDLYRVADQLASADRIPGVWRTDPYAHRPLVEFVLAIPGLTMWAPDVHRVGVRQALSDVLPPEILGRDTKQDFTAETRRAEREWAESLAETGTLTPSTVGEWQLVKRGYLAPAAVESALETWSLGTIRSRDIRLLNWVYLEAWLRTLAGDVPQARLSPRPGREAAWTPSLPADTAVPAS